MDDDGVVDLLRAAGHGGRESSPADVSRAMTAGRKIRRRTRAMQVVGSGLAIVAVLGVGITTVSALDGDGRGTAVTAPPDEAATNPPPAIATTAAAAREANNALLLSSLGPDFRINTREEGPGVTLRENTDSARNLPDGYYVTAAIWVNGPGDGYIGLEDLCTELVEESLRRSACVPVQTTDGQTVQVQTRQSVLKDGTIGGAYTMILAFFERPDGTVAEVRMEAADETAKASAARQQIAQGWLDGYREMFVGLAADPRIQSPPPTASGPEESTNFTNAEVLADYLAPPFVANSDGKVDLPAGSEYDPALPSDNYSVVGEITSVTQTQFDAVCKKDGAVSCSKDEAPGDREVWIWAYTDRDATASEVRGERAVYFVRDDGTIVLASLRLTGTGVSEAQEDRHVGDAHLWLARFDDALMGAATDSRPTFGE